MAHWVSQLLVWCLRVVICYSLYVCVKSCTCNFFDQFVRFFYLAKAMGFLFTLIIFITLTFQVLFSLMGIDFEGSAESPLYKLVVFGLDLCVCGYIVFKELINRSKRRGSALPYFIPLLVGFIYFLELIFRGPMGKNANNIFLFFFAFSTGGIYVSNYIYRFSQWD